MKPIVFILAALAHYIRAAETAAAVTPLGPLHDGSHEAACKNETYIVAEVLFLPIKLYIQLWEPDNSTATPYVFITSVVAPHHSQAYRNMGLMHWRSSMVLLQEIPELPAYVYPLPVPATTHHSRDGCAVTAVHRHAAVYDANLMIYVKPVSQADGVYFEILGQILPSGVSRNSTGYVRGVVKFLSAQSWFDEDTDNILAAESPTGVSTPSPTANSGVKPMGNATSPSPTAAEPASNAASSSPAAAEPSSNAPPPSPTAAEPASNATSHSPIAAEPASNAPSPRPVETQTTTPPPVISDCSTSPCGNNMNTVCTNAPGVYSGYTCTCSPGFGDCNNNMVDGCEVQLTSNDHCGACNIACQDRNCLKGSCTSMFQVPVQGRTLIGISMSQDGQVLATYDATAAYISLDSTLSTQGPTH